MDLATFQEILSFLPPQVQSFVLACLVALALFGIALLSVKGFIISALGTPQPTDPHWKTNVFHFFKWTDRFTPADFRLLLEVSRKEKEIRRLNAEAPPKPRIATNPPPPDRDAGVEQ